MKDAFGVTKAMSAKAGQIISSYGKMGNHPGRAFRLRAKKPMFGPHAGGSRNVPWDVDSTGKPVKWAQGKPADWV